jgi:hypothetical protein
MRECPRINAVVEANLNAMREVSRTSQQVYYTPQGCQGQGYPSPGCNQHPGHYPPPGPPPQGQGQNNGNPPSFAIGHL